MYFMFLVLCFCYVFCYICIYVFIQFSFSNCGTSKSNCLFQVSKATYLKVFYLLLICFYIIIFIIIYVRFFNMYTFFINFILFVLFCFILFFSYRKPIFNSFHFHSKKMCVEFKNRSQQCLKQFTKTQSLRSKVRDFNMNKHFSSNSSKSKLL